MEFKYKVKEYLLLQDIAEEHVVIARGPLALQFGGILVLNDACAVLWHKMSNFCSKDVLCQELRDTYGIDEERAKTDVDAFIQKMFDHNLIDIEQ